MPHPEVRRASVQVKLVFVPTNSHGTEVFLDGVAGAKGIGGDSGGVDASVELDGEAVLVGSSGIVGRAMLAGEAGVGDLADLEAGRAVPVLGMTLFDGGSGGEGKKGCRKRGCLEGGHGDCCSEERVNLKEGVQ